MRIDEMHVLFRQLGQQMGLQLVRGILPEEIDNLLNDAIVEKVRTILLNNTNVDFKNKIALDRNSISNLNALRTLYTETDYSPSDVMLYVGVTIVDNKKRYNCRLIDAVELDNTLNDYCSSASKDYPIATIVNDELTLYPSIHVYKWKEKEEDEIIEKDATIIYKFVKNPAKVSMPNNISCNLPDYLHYEVVENAVSKFYRAVGYTSPTANDNNK